ncbi:22976_t:CDS:2, partial [Gigaspora rosea]
LDILMADTNEDDTTYGSWYEFEFPKGDDFYIKTTTSPSGHSSASSTQNHVFDVDRDFFVSWDAVKEGSKLWYYDDGFLINKQTTLYLEPESVKSGSHLVLHHRRSGGQVANQKWTLTKEGRIALRNEPYVLEVKDKHVVLADASKASKHSLASQFIIIPLHPVEKGGLYDTGAYVVDTIKNAFTYDINKIDDHEKAEALIIVEESATPEKCKEIVTCQKDDGSIELGDTVCNDLDAPKEEIITTIQKNIKNNKLKNLPELPSLLSTAINLSYLKKAAPKHEGLWRNKYNKAREYLSKQIEDANAEKELLECADDYVIDNSIKKVIKDKKKNAVVELQGLTTSEKCNDVVSKQKNDGSFEISETICKEIDIPVDVVPVVKKETQNEKLKSPESEPWWKTALTLSYLKFAAPDHKKLWKDKEKKAHEYLSKEIGDVEAEKELLDCTDRYIVDNVTKKIEKDHKRDKAITIVQEAASPDKCQEIGSNQNDDGSIEEAKKHIETHFSSYSLRTGQLNPNIWSTAIMLWFIRYVLVDFRNDWVNKYQKAHDWICQQVPDDKVREELLEAARIFVVKRFE